MVATQCPFFFLNSAKNYHCLVSVSAVWQIGAVTVQAVLVLRNFFLSFFLSLRDCAVTRHENWHHVSNWPDKFQFKAISRHCRSLAALVLCWRLQKMTSLPFHQSRVWLDNVGRIITRLMWFPFLQYWLLLPKWVRNVNLHHPVHYEWKVCERQSVLKGN